MLAIKNGTNKNFEFTQDEVLKEFQNMKKENSLHKYKTTKSLLSKKVDEKYYLSEKIKKTILFRALVVFMLNQKLIKLRQEH